MNRLTLIVLRAACVIAMFLAWELVSGRLIPEYVISTPQDVVTRLVQLFQSGPILNDTRTTMTEFILGYGIGVGIGVVAALLLGSIRPLGQVVQPIIVALNSIPHIALAPAFVLLFGLGIASKVAVAASIVAFVTYMSVYTGLVSMQPDLINSVRLMGGGRWLVARQVTLPSLAPALIAALRTGVPLAMLGAVVGEFIASSTGLGFYIRRATENFDAAGLWAGLVVLVVLVTAMSGVLSVVEKRVVHWAPENQR